MKAKYVKRGDTIHQFNGINYMVMGIEFVDKNNISFFLQAVEPCDRIDRSITMTCPPDEDIIVVNPKPIKSKFKPTYITSMIIVLAVYIITQLMDAKPICWEFYFGGCIFIFGIWELRDTIKSKP